MPLTLNPYVFPPGGYYFDDVEGVRFRAENPAKLAAKMAEYRALNNLPAGNPLQEIDDQICARYPTGCRDRAGKKLQPGTQDLPLAGRVPRWLAIIIRGLAAKPGSYVSKVEANRRATICLSCPQQKNWQGGCKGCNDGMNRLTFAARKGQEAIGGEKLLGCRILGEDTRTSVFLDGLKPATDARLPAFCWRKAT